MKILHGISIFSKQYGKLLKIFDRQESGDTLVVSIVVSDQLHGMPGIPAINLGEYPIHGEVYVDCPVHTEFELFYKDVN